MKKLTLLLLIASLFIASSASPGMVEIDGKMLLENCQEAVRYMDNKNTQSVNFSSVNLCVGYISGVNDLHTTFVGSVACFDQPVFCSPRPANLEQLVKIVANFLNAHPENLHFKGSVLAVEALKDAFPCP
jgi:hypothetical protein